MVWWQILVPVVIGWFLGIGTIHLREKMVDNSTRKRIAKLMVAEIESNQFLLEKIKELKDSSSWEKIGDLQPAFAPFRRLAYLSFADKLGVLDPAIITKIQCYYSDIDIMEHSQKMISQRPDHPAELRRSFAEAYYASANQAAKLGNDLLNTFYCVVPSMITVKRQIKGSIRTVYHRINNHETQNGVQ